MSAMEKLKELGITLPETAPPVANYVPAVQSAGFLFLSGQLPLRNGQLLSTGKVGAAVTLEEAQGAARAAAVNALAAARDALGGDLQRVIRVARVVVYVNAVPDFTQQSLVANGASDLLVAVFGEDGRHARSAIGVGSLPLGAPVEVELTLHVRE